MELDKYKSFSNLDTEQMHHLLACMIICESCANKCVQEGHKKTAKACKDCAEVCDLAIKLKCTDSNHANQTLKLCEDVCKQCATECNQMEAQHCKECAQICKRCSEMCSEAHFHK
jgi:hypothetical protein